MAVTDLFKIQEIPNINGCNWSVTWPNYGKVAKSASQERLLTMAFDTGAYRVGIAFEGPFGRVLFLEATAWYQTSAADIIKYYEIPAITGVAFPELVNAEKFVDAAEKYISWKLLKYDYHG